MADLYARKTLGSMKRTRIMKTEGACGGEACVAEARIPVWTLVSLRQEGISDDNLLAAYPTLSLADLEAAWTYADGHWEEIERAISMNGEKIEEDLTRDGTDDV
jgi:uncharacterized protein (DUF433 family)